MSIHLKKFNLHTEYQTFAATDMLLPNVSHCITEQHVHYNPSLLKVSGVFTVPSKLLNVVEGDTSGGDDIPKKVSGGSSTSPSCYGLNNGIKVENIPTVTYEDESEILDCTYQILGTITDPNDNKEYKIIKLYYPYLVIDSQTEEVIPSNYSEVYENQTYYLPMNAQLIGRLDSNGVFECGSYDELTATFSTLTPPKTVIKTANIIDETNEEYTQKRVNCMVATSYDENDNPVYQEYNGTLTIVDNVITKYLIMPFDSINLLTQRNYLNSIIIDGQSIDFTALANNNGYMELAEGTHTITYYFNPQNGFYETLPVGTFQCVPIESLSVDSRFKCFMGNSVSIPNNAFTSCALLNTDEDTIKRICTLTSSLPFNYKQEPFIFECEFEDNDDYLVYGSSLFNQDYYAIHDGKVGMHVCVYPNNDGGGSIEK